MRRTSHLPLFSVLGALALLFVAAPSGAQATLSACYIPKSGTVYMIKQTGTPSECLSKQHVEFTWSGTGPQGPQGPQGPEGPQGPQGTAGAQGPSGPLSGLEFHSQAATIDPVSGARNSVITSLYGLLALLAFFAIDGHHQVLRALVTSYEGLPIGAGHVDASILAGVRQMLGLIFTVGVRLAAPIVLVLLIVELAVGLVSRSAPSLNFMVVGYPVRLIVGLLVLAAFVGTIPQVIASVAERTVDLGLTLAAAFK